MELLVQREKFAKGSFKKLYFVFNIQRKPLFFSCMLIIPVAMLSLFRFFRVILVTVLLYMLPADSCEKISSEITVNLSFSVLQGYRHRQDHYNEPLRKLVTRMQTYTAKDIMMTIGKEDLPKDHVFLQLLHNGST